MWRRHRYREKGSQGPGSSLGGEESCRDGLRMGVGSKIGSKEFVLKKSGLLTILSCEKPTIRALEKFTFRKGGNVGGKPTNVLPLAKGEGRRKGLTPHRLNDQMRTETLSCSPALRSRNDPYKLSFLSHTTRSTQIK